MATSHLYVTPAAFKSATQIPDGLGDEDVERALAAASGAIEDLAQRKFWLDPEPVTRVFTAMSCRMVVVDDITTITTVTSEGTAVTDYTTEPLNAVLDGKPYMWLVSEGSKFSTRRAQVAVTGRFGWPEVPAQVEQFVMIVAAKLVKRTREAPYGVLNTASLDGSAVRIGREDPDAALLVHKLRRNFPAVA